MEAVNEIAKQGSAAVSAEGRRRQGDGQGRQGEGGYRLHRARQGHRPGRGRRRHPDGDDGQCSVPAPAPTLAKLTNAHDAFVAAMEANDGGAKAVLARDQAREVLEGVVWQLATYVQHACQGNRLVLLTSGFTAQRLPSAGVAQPLAPPTALKVRLGRASGQASVRCARVRSARLYQWRYATAQAPTVWTLGDTTSRIVSTLTGLVPATQYLMQVRALGKQGASDWSDNAAMVAA